ncbi:MAG: imidazole glycerol phosphate synthase subunit HisH, partial [Candidatus Korobacteraceae bacterium]
VDYGAGNLTSVRKAFEHLGAEIEVTADPAALARAEKVVLPGVGHFSSTEAMTRNGMRHAIQQSIEQGKPFLGICVGLQWLYQGSEEAPDVPGLGLIQGLCATFPASVKSPHVGWNSIEVKPESRLLRGVPSGAFVYYTHSYLGPVTPETVACTHYGVSFAGAAERGHLFGVQFHPEKSGDTGLAILKNFCEL